MPRTLERLHLLDLSSPTHGWPLLRALAEAEERVAILGPQRAADEIARSTPGLDLICSACAPQHSARSTAIAIHRGLDLAGVETRTVVAWSDRAERAAKHPLSGIGSVVEPSGLLLAPPPPPVDFARSLTHGITRDELGVDDDQTLLVALGGSSGSVDAFAFAYLAGVLSLAGLPLVTVVPKDAKRLDRSLRFVERHNHAWRAVVAECELPELLGIADVAAYLPPDRPTAQAERAAASLRSELAWLLDAGMACVIQAEPPIAAMLEDIDASSDTDPRVLTVACGEPGLSTVRVVERALKLGRREPSNDPRAFQAWASALGDLGHRQPAMA